MKKNDNPIDNEVGKKRVKRKKNLNSKKTYSVHKKLSPLQMDGDYMMISMIPVGFLAAHNRALCSAPRADQ
jgi:hypothetical protein